MPENLHLGYGTLARPLIEPELQRDVSLVTVAGRPHEPSVQHLVRAIRAHNWRAELAKFRHGPSSEQLTITKEVPGDRSPARGN
jgi:hypothetical protein